MAFPTNPSPGDSYTDEYGTVWVYAGTVNGWYRQEVSTPNDTSYTAAISGPAGSNTQVQFNDNGELAGDSGLTYNKTTDALSGGAFIPTGSTIPTNGVYRPSANNVAISTNGTGRLFVDAAGSVRVEKAGAGGVEVVSTVQSTIYFSNAARTGGYIIGRSIGSDNAHNLFSYDATNSHYIDYFEGGSSGYRSFYTNGSERLRITSAGLVGIGTSSPSYQFHVSNTGASALGVFTRTSGASCYIEGGATSGTVGTVGSHNLGFTTNSTTAMTIDTSQRVGIGTTNPSHKLDVSGNIRANTGAQAGSIYFGADDYGVISKSSTDFRIWSRQAIPLTFLVNDVERARIDSSGRLLVGTSSTPDADYTSTIAQNGPQGGALYLSRNLNANQILSAGYPLGTIAIGARDLQAARISCISDGTGTASTLPGRLVFSTTADGASSPTEQLRITSDRYVRLASGSGGIQFNGDTAAANALDDYEEGTWTPTLTGVSGGSGQTYTTQSGSYVKIGDLVVLTFSVTLSAKGTMTGNPVIGGIPFAGAGQTGQNTAMNLSFSDLNITPNGVGYSARAGSFAQLYLRKNISGVISLFAFGNADFTDTSNITGTISYRVSA